MTVQDERREAAIRTALTEFSANRERHGPDVAFVNALITYDAALEGEVESELLSVTRDEHRKAVIERMAKAIYEDGELASSRCVVLWEQIPEHIKDIYRSKARAVYDVALEGREPEQLRGALHDLVIIHHRTHRSTHSGPYPFTNCNVQTCRDVAAILSEHPES